MPTTFQDRELTLTGAALTAPGTAADAVLGNGHLELRMSRAGAGAGTATPAGEATFEATRFVLAGGADPAPDVQRLHLASGTWSASAGSFETRVRALRQLPNCALQSVTAGPGARVEHALAPPPGSVLERADHVVLNVGGIRVPCLCAEARTATGYLGYACAYLVSGADGGGDAVHEGARTDAGGGVTRDYATLGPSGSLHCLHVHVAVPESGAAAGFRARELVAVAVKLCAGRATALASANTRRWAALWNAVLRVEPRAPSDAQVAALNVALDTGLYRVLSGVRDDVSFAVNAPHARDPWVSAANPYGIAALVALRPRAALPVLESSQRFAPDTPLATLARFATDVWAVFRATLDREWLRDAYRGVQAAVDEITVRVEVSDLTDAVSAATTVLIKYAFEAAVQTSYELRVRPRAEWLAADSRLEMPAVLGPADAELAYVMHPYAFRTSLGQHARVLSDNKASTDLALASPSDAVLRLAGLGVAVTPAGAPLADLAAALAGEAGPDDGWRLAGSAFGLDQACALVSAVAWGFARSRLTGYVSSDGFHMQSAGVTRPRHAPLPPAWAAVRFRQAVAGGAEFLTAGN